MKIGNNKNSLSKIFNQIERNSELKIF